MWSSIVVQYCTTGSTRVPGTVVQCIQVVLHTSRTIYTGKSVGPCIAYWSRGTWYCTTVAGASVKKTSDVVLESAFLAWCQLSTTKKPPKIVLEPGRGDCSTV